MIKPSNPFPKPEKYQMIMKKLFPDISMSKDWSFIFSDETSFLDEIELKNSIKLLDKISVIIELRSQLLEQDYENNIIYYPSGAWGPEYRNSIEYNNSVRNVNDSYGLLAKKDYDIIRKLRFYCEGFTGYQLATLELASKRPWIANKLPDDWDQVLCHLAGPIPSEVFQTISIADKLPPNLRLRPPKKFGEIGWLVSDEIFNHDLLCYQQIISLMFENGIIELLNERLKNNEIIRIVEIGGGYGALAFYLSQIFNSRIKYSIVDIPESLAFASVYCSSIPINIPTVLIEKPGKDRLMDQPCCEFIPNIYSSVLEDRDRVVDLCINTLSLAEMSPDQVEHYCSLIQKLIGRTGMFFEQNRASNELKLESTFPKYFKKIRKCKSKLFTHFKEFRGEANLWANADWRK